MVRANDPSLRSWIDISPESDFPIQNLPFGVFQTETRDPRVGIAIGSYVLDLYAVCQQKLFELLDMEDPTVFHRDSLNDFMALGKPAWREVRNRVSELLRYNNGEIRDDPEIMHDCLLKMTEVELLLPVKTDNYAGFYSSTGHVPKEEAMFREPADTLVPNWKHLQAPYHHGRASSIVVSGANIHRPKGQIKSNEAESPVFGPSRQLDFALEMAFITGRETQPGASAGTHEADDYVFGLVLFNDWLARDIQEEESVPLGPISGKSFATSISPWVVTLDALEPFRVKGPAQETPVLAYHESSMPRNLDLQLEVWLQPEHQEPVNLCRSNTKNLYWNMNQQLAYQTSNGGNLQVGDLYASGTISDSSRGSYGSLQELTWRGARPLILPDGSERNFIHDGDCVIMRAHAEKNGLRIGFGEVRTKVLPAV